jgi:hypothetical protein
MSLVIVPVAPVMSMIMVVIPVVRTPVLVVGAVVYIPRLVFLRSNEIHGPTASVVLVAVLVPIFGVPWRYM